MYREEISRWVEAHREEMVEDLKKLIRIPSEKGEAEENAPFGPGPAAALQAALEMAGSYGFTTENHEGYVGTVDFFPENDHRLDILSHLDVVPVNPAGWTVTAPYEPVVEDGKIYGRGSSDDKGPSVAALYALRCVRELQIPVQHNIRLIWGCDEECGSEDIAWYYQREKEAEYTFSPDADFPLVNLEKGGLFGEISAEFPEHKETPRVLSVEGGVKVNVVPETCTAVIEGMRRTVAEIYCAGVSEKTGVVFTITEAGENKIAIEAKGRGGHAAEPDKANNAVTAMLELLAYMHLRQSWQTEAMRSLSQLIPHGDTAGTALGVEMSDEISGALTLSLDLLRVTPTSLSATFDSRCPLCATEQNMKYKAMRTLARHGLVLKDTPMRPPHHVPAESYFVKTLLKSYSKYTGVEDPEPLAIGGGTYCHGIANGVAFGCVMPGTDTRMHGNDEFAVVQELLDSVKIFADAIAELCGPSDGAE